MHNDIKYNEYFKWLCAKVGMPLEKYSYLMRHLFSRKFEWYLPHDSNRVADGIEMREQFERESGGYFESFPNWQDCTILEMLVAFSQRLFYETDSCDINENVDMNAPTHFTSMIKNLGLDDQTNPCYDKGTVDEILDIWMRREFDEYGNGGLFPLFHTALDQRNIEFWYQACSWLYEKYGI